MDWKELNSLLEITVKLSILYFFWPSYKNENGSITDEDAEERKEVDKEKKVEIVDLV